MSLNLKLGQLIVRLRSKHALSQEHLALNAGIDRRYLSDLENGRRNPSLAYLGRIGAQFGLTAAQLIALAEQPFACLDDLKEHLVDLGFEESIVLESPDYLCAVAGITPEGRVVYFRQQMVLSLMIDDGMTADEAEEFIDYNTVRALPYMGAHAPIIIEEL